MTSLETPRSRDLSLGYNPQQDRRAHRLQPQRNTQHGGSAWLAEDDPEDFPRVELFTDCCGQARRFEVSLHTTDGGYFLRATEIREGPGGYEFAAHAESSPYLALGRLRQRIAQGLATRYLVVAEGQQRLSHDREGWQFEIRVVDPYEAL